MIGPVNILSKDRQIYLEAGKYKILCLGGWGVELNEFEIKLKEIEGAGVLNSRKAKWPVQSYVLNKRAKRIGTVEVLKSGNYILEFIHPYSLRVKKSNLFFASRFEKFLDTKAIDVVLL
ncbi:hypothetical protein CJ305_14020 [Leeuwenhoekiella nanhaiensis]|uniref:Uncharacterized protein n=1 Tax=Leeuwenhoekiella nanhaiensis TaxID=1655491 RepID=A0A2G1VPD6_9FLAO|nr:hypothetical protein CJ305_14020 [Leeuwenhoekiella nanhaiensis]